MQEQEPFRFSPPEWLDETASTSDCLKERVATGTPPPAGTVVAARKQTAGRGRMGASWLSAREGDVMFSFVWTGAIGPDQAGTLPLACGLGVRDFLAAAPFRVPAACKWPNDIFVGDGKMCGILTEGGVAADGLLRLVVGIGINIRARPGRDAAIGRTTVSLEELVPGRYHPEELLPGVLRCLENRINAWQRGGFPAIRADFTANLWGLGRTLTARLDGGRVTGVVTGIGDNGELAITLPDGSGRLIASVSAIEGL
ncbi:MAG: biotin--[acetyl-CoA-carboxylase] ligase [Planctomycetes bacterium]|nr:biotin--[acetyl-CoA-carboxylase] ligase [Planctomycetota bacterium]